MDYALKFNHVQIVKLLKKICNRAEAIEGDDEQYDEQRWRSDNSDCISNTNVNTLLQS